MPQLPRKDIEEYQSQQEGSNVDELADLQIVWICERGDRYQPGD